MSNSRLSRAGRWCLASAALLLTVAPSLSLPQLADAKRSITTGIAAPEYGSLDGAWRDLWFDQTVQANADLVRIDVVWGAVVGAQRPADPTNPADPAYDFSGLDAAVRDSARHGLEPMLTVYLAPNWAEAPGRPDGIRPGAWRPDPAEFGNFGAALARRYSGSFSPAGRAPLPRVRYFEAWNEPNLEGLLAPQWVDGRPEAPAIYRGLLNSFYDAVKGVARSNTVISSATAPFGDPRSRASIRPVAFLRQLFCLEGRKKLKPRPRCPRVKLDILSHHPISLENPPTYSAIHPDDAATSDIDRLRRVLRAAEKADVVRPGGKRPIWATELWWISKPPRSEFAVRRQVHARYLEQALYVLWKQRVRVAIQFLIRDTPGSVVSNPFKTGLFTADGERKPAFRAFRFPFVTERRRQGKRVRAWGTSPKSGKVKIQAKKRNKWRTLERIPAREDEVFTARLQESNRMRARIGGEKSLVWKQRR